MSERWGPVLVLHGLVVLLIGLLAGIPYGTAIVNEWSAEAQRAWKLAHLEGVQNGILVIAVAACSRYLTLGKSASRIVAWGFVTAAYGNVLGASLGAMTGQRGLEPAGPLANWLVFIGFMFGMWGVLIGTPVAAAGALRTLRRAD